MGLKRRDIVKLVTCEICDRSMTKPKSLICMHSFCEPCLSAYIIKLTEGEGRVIEKFKCPSCQADNQIPNTSLPVESWVHFITPSSMVSFLQEKMSLESSKICDPCKRGNTEIDAMSWCKDCGEALCEPCTDYHKRVKILMDHKVTSFEQMRKQPPEISEAEEFCTKHNGKLIEAFCDDHDAICCVECITENHRQCQMVSTIDQMSVDIKRKLDPLLQRVEGLQKQAVSVVDNRKTNMEDLLKQREDILTEVNRTRAEVQQYFETLEVQLKEEIAKTHEELNEKLQLQAKSFEYIFNSCDNGKRHLTASLACGTDRDTFLTAYKIRKECERHEFYIKTQSEHILRHDYSLHMNEIIKTFTEKIRDMGYVSVDKTATNILPAFYRDMRVSKIADMSGKSWSDIGHCWFTGCLFLKDNFILMCDYRNRKLKSFNSSNTLVFELVLDENPWDACFLQNDLEEHTILVLVSFPGISVGKVVKIDSGGKMIITDKEYELGVGAHGLHRDGDRIYIACSNEIRMLSLKTMEVSSMSIGNRGARYVVCTKKSGICYSTKASVTCHDRKGKETFRYKDPELRSTRGVAEDDEGNIYVCGIDSNNVHQLLPDGSFVKTILSSKDDIHNPYVIRFEPKSTRFVVTQMDSDIAKLYQLVTMW